MFVAAQSIFISGQRLRHLIANAVNLLICLWLPSLAVAQTTFYTDFNTTIAGLGTNQSFTWDTKGNSAVWNTSNLSTNIGAPVSWSNATSPNNAVFGAGTAAGAPFTATLGSDISVGTVSVASDSWIVNTNGAGNKVYNLTFNSNTADSSPGVNFVVQGSGAITKAGSNTLTLSGSSTFTGGTTVSAGTLALASTSALSSGSNVTLAGGTLLLSAAGTYTFGNINVSSNSTIDFGGAGVTNLSLTSLTIQTGATLTIQNWVRYSDSFTINTSLASNFTIGGQNVTQGVGITGGVTFSNYSELAQWNSTSFSTGQLAAVPEPSTYGAMLMAGCAGLFGWRRWRRKDKVTAPSA